MSLLRNRFAWVAIVALALVGGVVALRVDAGTPPGKPAAIMPPGTPVDVATVLDRSITDWHDYSGRLEAVNRVEIRPLVSGTLVAVHFKDGSLVKKGDVLFTIDPRPYAATVDRAKAQLAAAQARAAYTASDLARGQRLLADNAIARRDFEEKRNASREAAANLQAAKAALESAELDLEHTRISAPIEGRMSRAELTVGNVVAAGAGSKPLATLVSVAHMYASFDVDEQSFLKFVNPAREGRGTPLPVYLGLANEDAYPRKGRLESVDNQLDTSSGTIRVRAEFDNPDGELVPGLYARIRLGGGAPHQAVLIDEKAIGTDQDKRFVLVVDGADKASYREVRIGANYDGFRVIQSGLKAGERIVVNGLQRVRPGDQLNPKIVLMESPRSLAASDPAKSADSNKS
ncbi:efflux RND transporter periplasmic adaptor subunit [Paralcaligenes sp. KSB-10]|uniref:efflux RND transporter periplasmic adaptor subunit n=1 Tax=Paralcaligenes sp. KSB-10 TaxID=2901142 RepID=UPI001E63E661|nr:efflux RND transporter periplasmic adaptor subunit [Paralcaligenes sp. KSB-10]UHL64702.1 efflux RND transporter periplasmic adaptor subunit [Paralcaligenes sp. KSB-10]